MNKKMKIAKADSLLPPSTAPDFIKVTEPHQIIDERSSGHINFAGENSGSDADPTDQSFSQ